MQINLTKTERAALSNAIYRIFPDIEDYEAGILDRVVEDIIIARIVEITHVPTDVRDLERKLETLKHNVWATYNFMVARYEPEKWCCSGVCTETNWGGKDRVHRRGYTCPEYDAAENGRQLRAAGAI